MRWISAIPGILVDLAVSFGLGCGERGDAQPRASTTRAEAKAAKKPQPIRTMRGQASFYGKRFHGKSTASGERFDMHELTAAHQRLPFGSEVRVTNLRNDETVTVEINDRGPWGAKGRIIDLSRAAARDLEMIDRAVAPVKLEVMSLGER